MENVQATKQRFGIIGNDPKLNPTTEKESKKSDLQWSGRTQYNKFAVFLKENYKIGDTVMLKIEDCSEENMMGKTLEISK